ncbi:hypothetical protein LCGC14_2179920 [marine sediment metagenome]|uniref:Uncharacterized protein n=1 Tax=marine sediment metagenome TaxID=412755 RepID=A0A0F9E9T1_9ZZZZ
MQIDPTIVTAIMALFGIGVIGIVEFVKRIFGTTGKAVVNFIITAVVSAGATAAYLVQADMFSIGMFIIYSILIFGEASGLYHVFAKKTA